MPTENKAIDAPKSPVDTINNEEWSKTCSILLDDAKVTGDTCGERLGKFHAAEKTMCTALEAFAADGFALVDTNKNGYLSPAETKAAIAKTPTGVNKDVLKYIDKNSSSIQTNSDDEYFWERSGVTKKDLNKTGHALHLKFDEKLSNEVQYHLKNEDLEELESLVHQMEPGCVGHIMNSVKYGLPGDTIESRLDFRSSTKEVNGKTVGTAHIDYSSFSGSKTLEFSTDPSVPAKAYYWKTEGWLGKGNWVKSNPHSALDLMGDEARRGRIHYVP